MKRAVVENQEFPSFLANRVFTKTLDVVWNSKSPACSVIGIDCDFSGEFGRKSSIESKHLARSHANDTHLQQQQQQHSPEKLLEN